MATLDNNILGQNKIPGSEKFTRPEEIKALSKYLGKIKKTQEDHTNLGEESLALFGRNTGKLVEIEKLSDHEYLDKLNGTDQDISLVDQARPMIDNESEDIVDLLQKKIRLAESENEGSNVGKLDDHVERISDTLDIEKLPTRTVEINPSEAPEDWTKKLLKDVIKIQGEKKEVTLPTDSVDLDIPDKTTPLSTTKEELIAEDKVQSLRPHQKLDELNDDRSTPLSTKRENIVDDRDIELNHEVESLKVNDNVELPDDVVKISDERPIELSDFKEELDANEEIELPTDKEILEVTDIRNLPDTKVDLSVEDTIDSLPDSSEKLEDDREVALSDYKETIEDKRDSSLSDYRERIDVTDIDSLSDKRVDIKDDREIELPKEKIDITDEKEVKLPYERLDINNEKNIEELPKDKENILSNYGLSEINKLPDSALKITDDKEVELSKTKKTLEGDIPEISELEEEKIQIKEGLKREPDSLDESVFKLDIGEDVNELSNFIENINLDNIPDIQKLPEEMENLFIERQERLDIYKEHLDVEEKVKKLEDGIYVIDNDTRPPLKNLPDDKIWMKSNENTSPLTKQLSKYDIVDKDSLKAAIDEIVKTKDLNNTDLFNRVIKLLQDIKKDSTLAIGSKEWVDRTEAMVTSYFNENNKERLGGSNKEDDNFIQDWIDKITYESWNYRRFDHPIPPADDPRQFDVVNSEISGKTDSGEEIIDNFFSYLLKAKSVEELKQLLQYYQLKTPDLVVPKNMDNKSFEKYLKDLEDFDQEGSEITRAKILPATIFALQQLIKERENSANVWVPNDQNNYDNNTYTFTKRVKGVDGAAEVYEKFDFIGALIKTRNLESFKELLRAHNESDKKYNQKLTVSETNSGEIDYVGRLTEWLFNYHSDRARKEKYKFFRQEYDKNGTRPPHQIRDNEGNWVSVDSDPLKDKAGNVDPALFSSTQRLMTRGEYKLPNSATWGSIMGNVIGDDGDINVFGIANLLSNPGANINLNKYLRYTAEKLTDSIYGLYTKAVDKMNEIGTGIKGVKVGNLASQVLTQYTGIPTSKRRMLEETLGMLVYLRDQLERVTEANRDRLPGDSVLSQFSSAALLQGTKGVGDKLIGMAKAAIGGGSLKVARNRPGIDAQKAVSRKLFSAGVTVNSSDILTTAFQENKRSESDSNYEKESKYLKAAEGSSYIGGIVKLSNRFSTRGVGTTLRELAGYDTDDGPVESLEQLKDILMNAPFITTPNKFGSIGKKSKVQTLSSNSFWEIKLEPFVHNNMNGGFSYLPSIREINVMNLKNHGIYTGYNEWLPITGFELERTKLSTKTLGIYDGEIVYPIGCEFLNELSITMINDSLKSWSTYWRRVMEVSTHSSEPHNAEFYEDPYPLPTVIDHTAPLIALYKNITWRCQIYILSPQYSTLRKFDLLVVLKDYTESYAGEIDSPGGDIQLRFSVVGENPPKQTDLISYDEQTLNKEAHRVAKTYTDESGVVTEEEAKKWILKKRELDREKEKNPPEETKPEPEPEEPVEEEEKTTTTVKKNNTPKGGSGKGKGMHPTLVVENINGVYHYHMDITSKWPDPNALGFTVEEVNGTRQISGIYFLDYSQGSNVYGSGTSDYVKDGEGRVVPIVNKTGYNWVPYFFGSDGSNKNSYQNGSVDCQIRTNETKWWMLERAETGELHAIRNN